MYGNRPVGDKRKVSDSRPNFPRLGHKSTGEIDGGVRKETDKYDGVSRPGRRTLEDLSL